tara:strand:- start:1307 stop:1438 length:132 start_codon:yes stop_codon:yes gene_type:complete
MVKRTYKKTDKKGREETWEWEETPELLAALERLHSNKNERNLD